MSDQEIIDTIADVFARQETRFPGMLASGRTVAGRILAALRERYAIVPRPEPPIGGYEHIVESGKKRYAIVELPEPEYGPDVGGQYGWTSPVAPVSTCDGRVWEEDCDMEPHEAQEHAAALLAAAGVCR